VRQSDITFEAVEAHVRAGWSQWLPLTSDAIKNLPPLPGVYEVRLKGHSFPRLRGQTNTIYIGSAEKRELAKRLNGLLKGRHVARHRIEKIKSELKTDLEFRFRVELAARQLEQELLREYECEHLELPPCNHNIARKRA
jgi:excinuclease UvrABC nuclease subunit